MRTRRTQNRRKSCYASVVEHLESRYLLSGSGDLIADTQLSIDPPLGILTADQPPIVGTIDDANDQDLFIFTAAANGKVFVQQGAAPVSEGTLPLDGVLQVFVAGSGFALNHDEADHAWNSCVR